MLVSLVSLLNSFYEISLKLVVEQLLDVHFLLPYTFLLPTSLAGDAPYIIGLLSRSDSALRSALRAFFGGVASASSSVLRRT